ncbi:hypothetical protein B0H14DRAFT_2765330 [Mycena olivaceomarginata]|nr:hypothetical protein B0H14DRAFT_2765330 [Mycena olivaceomarginata]
MLKGCFKCGTDTMKLGKGQAYGCIQSSGGCVRHRALQMGFVANSLFKPNSSSLIIQPQIKPAINGQTCLRDVLGSEFRAKFNLKQMERPHWIERRWGKLPTRQSSSSAARMWSLKVGLRTTKEPTLRDLYVTLAVLPEVSFPVPAFSFLTGWSDPR